MSTRRKILLAGHRSMYFVGTISFVLTIIVTYIVILPQVALNQIAAKKTA